jgi:hypothetical protein
MAKQQLDRATDLETQIRWLADIEEIKQLQARFWYACDGDPTGSTHDYEEIVNLFTDAGSLSISISHVAAHGRDALLDFFKAAQHSVPFAMHVGITPIIDIDGDIATGKWKLLALVTLRDGAEERGYWSGNLYNVTYRRIGSAWRIHDCAISTFMFTPFDQGWGAERLASVPVTSDGAD